jgi:hypothetical protein
MRLSRLCVPLALCALPLALALALAGCQGDPNEEAMQCPKPYLLPDASSATHYDGRGTDISDLVLSAKLTDVHGACVGKMGKREETAHAHVVMLVTRGPQSKSNEADIPYSVGVVRAGDVLDEAHYVQHVVFPSNVDSVEVTGQEVKFVLPTARKISGSDYHFYFWLNLTPEEVESNRLKK